MVKLLGDFHVCTAHILLWVFHTTRVGITSNNPTGISLSFAVSPTIWSARAVNIFHYARGVACICSCPEEVQDASRTDQLTGKLESDCATRAVSSDSSGIQLAWVAGKIPSARTMSIPGPTTFRISLFALGNQGSP